MLRCRQALRAHGVTIKNKFGEGWYIEQVDRPLVRRLLGIAPPDDQAGAA